MAEKKKQNTGQMRLDKFLTEMGNEADQVKDLRRGRIQVNGQTVKAADTKVNPEKDEIFLDGVPVSYARMEYFMLNKPQGTVSTTEDVRYPTVVSLIGDALRGDLFPVGRLDLDTEGLLLITNVDIGRRLRTRKNMWIRSIWLISRELSLKMPQNR